MPNNFFFAGNHKIPGIKNLDFDIPHRKLTIYHDGPVEPIERSIIELNLGGKILETETTDHIDFIENAGQRRLLWIVLGINFAFFIVEAITGLISKSMGLVADGLDMLADAFVYGISLWAVGGSLVRKKNVAKLVYR